MKGKRDFSADLLWKTGATRLVSAVRPRLSRLVTILAYHRVLDVPDEDAFPFDIELVSASVGSFAEQMRFVRLHFTPITFADLLRHLDGGEPPPRGAVIVTFDDGFAANYRNAFPVLRELGIPATIFQGGRLPCSKVVRLVHRVLHRLQRQPPSRHWTSPLQRWPHRLGAPP